MKYAKKMNNKESQEYINNHFEKKKEDILEKINENNKSDNK